MTLEEKKQLWGNNLYKAFENNIDENGWLTEGWTEILNKEMPDFDEDYNDNEEKKRLFWEMNNMIFEESEDGLFIRPVEPFVIK